MKTQQRLADNSVVSVNTVFELAKEQHKSAERKISKILAKYECKDESLLDEGKMSEVDQALYSSLFETRQDINNLLSQLINLAD